MNSDVSNKYTKNVINKSIELILLGENIKNRSISKLLNIADQQSFYINAIKEKLYSSTLSFEEIYEQLNIFDPKIIPIIIAAIIKDHIDYIVIEKSGEEQPITSKTIEQINENPHLYTVTYIKEHEKFDMYKDIFKLEDRSTNIFFNIVDEMQSCFFNLSKYASVTTQEYIGKGKYKKVPEDITKFKDSLRGIQNNPFYYVSKKITEIFESDEIYQLKQSKCFIDNTLNKIKKTLQNDINYIFPETIDTWYRNLSTDIKNRIFADGEEKFLLLCKNKNNDNDFIESIAKYLTGISLENWDDNTPTYFYNRLMQIRNIIENNENKKIDNGFIINYISGTNKFSKILEIPQNTNKGIEKVMINDLTALFNDYGNSMCHSAKVALALKVALGEVN